MPELLWEGKYDANGQIVGPPRVSLPFQTVETVNQSAQERQIALTTSRAGHSPEWRNRLIWGDKKYVLPSLLDEFAGKVDLIYIDPPFASGSKFGYKTNLHPDDNGASQSLALNYQPNLIEQIAYRDTWGGGLDTYLQWMCESLTFLRELLSESGSIYVHCDWRTSHYAKIELDRLFGYENFLNEIVWHYQKWSNVARYFQRNHDIVLSYAKGDAYVFNKQFEISQDKRRKLDIGYQVNRPGGVKQLLVYDREKAATKIAEGDYDKVVYRDEEDPGTMMADTWSDINILNSQAKERIGYDTQKPESLLERIISASSNPGDLVLDCFIGSGTTAAVAEKLGRRWIAADMGRFAISTTRKRLLDIPNVKPFYVQNLGRYERQAWQSADLERDYREFILQLYKAEPVNGYQWLHGAKAGRMVHVGSVDAPVALDDVQRVVEEFGNTIGTGDGTPTANGVDILGWDFGLEVDTETGELARNAGINVRLMRIPREVMDQKAVAAGDVQFFELASLSVAPHLDPKKRKVTLTLEDFLMPRDGVPDDVRQAVTHWSQWIDYWAVDWDYQADTFNNQWQSYRTRQELELSRSIFHTYNTAGARTIVVKVIDILGNDTTRRLEVTV